MAARRSDPGVSDTEAHVPPERWEGVDPSPREPWVKDQAKQLWPPTIVWAWLLGSAAQVHTPSTSVRLAMSLEARGSSLGTWEVGVTEGAATVYAIAIPCVRIG